MKFLEYVNARAERRLAWKFAKLETQGQFSRMIPTDFRGWLGLALFLQSTFLFTLLAAIPKLNENQGFLTLASAVIVTGWIGGAAAFAYAAGKNSAERSEQVTTALRILDNQAGSGDKPDVTLKPGETAQAESTLPERP